MPRNTTEKIAAEILKPQQLAVLERLLVGESVAKAAEAAGIDRSTVHRWQREDYAFQAAYNRRRRELYEAAQTRLLALAEEAADIVANAVRGGDTRAAIAVLKGLGLIPGEPLSIGSDDPEVVRVEAELAEEEAKTSRMMRRLSAAIKGMDSREEPADTDKLRVGATPARRA